MSVLQIVIAVLVGALGVWRLRAARPASFYAWDESNPDRRRCRDCGQRWEPRYLNDDPQPGMVLTWEPEGEVGDPGCRCHRNAARPLEFRGEALRYRERAG